MSVINYQTGEVCIVDFKSEGWGGKNRHYLEGYCFNSVEESKAKRKVPTHKINGTWTGEISC